MAKSDISLENINIEPATRKQTTANWRDAKQINAFDTETFRGSVFMLSYAIGDLHGVEEKGYISQLDSKTIIKKLTNRQCRSAINVWYNLDFDANAILSSILSFDELKELSVTTETTTKIDSVFYEIKYVKGKFLLIEDSNGNNYKHFDISQFFYAPLDEASEEWLNDKKVEDIDTSRFDDASYIMDNYDDIREYAIKDAKLTQRLGHKLVSEAESLDIPMGMPFSTGYLSAEYIRANTDEKPDFGDSRYQSMFWDSYYGGRFEVFERGQVGEVAAPDINSAYPAVMRNLPDPETLDWMYYSNESVQGRNIELDDIKTSDYGVVDVTVSTDPNAKIQPFAQKVGGRVTFPVLTNARITVIAPIFEFAVKEGLVTDYQINEAWLGHEREITEYPFTWLNGLYADRKQWEIKEGKEKKGKLVKIVINSSYGKTCQTTEHSRIVKLSENDEYELDYNEKLQPRGFMNKNQRDILDEDEVVVKNVDCGRRFNPFVASYITGMTRLELHKQVVEHNLVDDTVMFATDCLMVRKDAYEESDFDGLIQQPDASLEGEQFRQSAIDSLGKWDYDYRGDAFIVGSGVYEVNTPNGLKTKTRGFLEKAFDGSLKEEAANHPEGIPLQNPRPLTINEVVRSPDDGNVAEFVEDSKVLPPDFDQKREWGREETTFTHLLTERQESEPIDLAEKRKGEYEPTKEQSELEYEELSTRDLPLPNKATVAVSKSE